MLIFFKLVGNCSIGTKYMAETYPFGKPAILTKSGSAKLSFNKPELSKV